jgi:hypothetical protein
MSDNVKTRTRRFCTYEEFVNQFFIGQLCSCGKRDTLSSILMERVYERI